MGSGGIKGIATDGLRLLALAGPLGKGAQMAKAASNRKIAQLIVDPGGKICSWMAATKALTYTGHRRGTKLYASLDDLIRAVKPSKSPLEKGYEGISLYHMRQNLIKIGIPVGPIKTPRSLRELGNMLPFDRSVVQVSLRILKKDGTEAGYAVLAVRDWRGLMKIIDRTPGKKGVYDFSRKVDQDNFLIRHSSVKIAPRYAFHIPKARVMGLAGVTVLAIEVKGVIGEDR